LKWENFLFHRHFSEAFEQLVQLFSKTSMVFHFVFSRISTNKTEKDPVEMYTHSFLTFKSAVLQMHREFEHVQGGSVISGTLSKLHHGSPIRLF
jgi:hypothetical protein